MRVLLILPPQIPSYFNAGHHTPLFMVAGHLRAQPETTTVDVVDAAVLNMNWKAVGDLLFQGAHDVVGVMNDFDAVDGVERFLLYCRALSPQAQIVTFGRLASVCPKLFRQFDVDAVVESGDYETGVLHFVRHVLRTQRGQPDGQPGGLPGVAMRHDGRWFDPSDRGEVLAPADWVLPDVGEIPYDAYDRLYVRDEHKFCGIPLRRELVVPVARGCPIGCEFCEVPTVFGLRERRISVDRTLEYIADAFARGPFEYVSFYAPTFTLDRRWVTRLCDRFIAWPDARPWKCATTVQHLDESLVAHMGRSGCVRISVGLETLDAGGGPALPRVKRIDEQRFERLAEWCAAAQVELNAFVIVGFPGTTPEGTARTIAFAQSLGARVRPTMYNPIHLLNAGMAAHEASRFNRQLVPENPAGPGNSDLYEVVFGGSLRLTNVQERIPARHAPEGSGVVV